MPDRTDQPQRSTKPGLKGPCSIEIKWKCGRTSAPLEKLVLPACLRVALHLKAGQPLLYFFFKHFPVFNCIVTAFK